MSVTAALARTCALLDEDDGAPMPDAIRAALVANDNGTFVPLRIFARNAAAAVSNAVLRRRPQRAVRQDRPPPREAVGPTRCVYCGARGHVGAGCTGDALDYDALDYDERDQPTREVEPW